VTAAGRPPAPSLLDWRRRVADLYAQVRRLGSGPALSTRTSTGTLREAHDLWRTGRDDLLRTHPDSPLPPSARAGFAGVQVDAYDRDLRFDVQLGDPGTGRRWEVATATDGTVPFDLLGTAELPGLGVLDVWWLGSYGGGVFVPLRDPSPDTYGGGRYLLDTVKGADLGGDALAGRLVLDLNFAYNPSCAYDPAWVCPLAPPGNTLAVAVRGGERTP